MIFFHNRTKIYSTKISHKIEILSKLYLQSPLTQPHWSKMLQEWMGREVGSLFDAGKLLGNQKSLNLSLTFFNSCSQFCALHSPDCRTNFLLCLRKLASYNWPTLPCTASVVLFSISGTIKKIRPRSLAWQASSTYFSCQKALSKLILLASIDNIPLCEGAYTLKG